MQTGRYLRLATFVAGIYACFLTWAVLQERVSAQKWCAGEGEDSVCEQYTHVVVLNCIQAFTAAVVAFVCLLVRKKPEKGKRIELATGQVLLEYCKVALSHTLASPFGYASLQHINYPTHVLAKSCKLVPVILTGTILYRRRFEWYKYTSVALITAGVAWFTLAKKSRGEDRANSIYGLLLVFINLALDGYTNASQDELFHKYKLSSFGMMLNLNLAGFAIMAAYLLSPWSSQLADAIAFFGRHPGILQDIVLFCLCGAVGQIFVYGLLQDFGSLVLVSVTVTRKLFTIFLSCLWYGHTLNVQQYAAVAVVFVGISLESFMKERRRYLSRRANGVGAKAQ